MILERYFIKNIMFHIANKIKYMAYPSRGTVIISNANNTKAPRTSCWFKYILYSWAEIAVNKNEIINQINSLIPLSEQIKTKYPRDIEHSKDEYFALKVNLWLAKIISILSFILTLTVPP